MTVTDPARAKPKRARAQPPDADLAFVRELAHLLQQTNLSEIEIDRGDLHIRLARHAAAAPAPHHAAAPQQMLAPPPAAPGRMAAESEEANPHAVPSPMVGTAYRRASPDAKAFVEVGSKVAAGEKILLIEAMKTFNDIVAPRAGTVTAIMIEDGMPVEYGQAQMVIE